MTAATSRLRRRGIGAGVAALVGLTGLGFAAVPAQAAAGFDPAASQVSGTDRFDTAARIATSAFPGGSDTVVVANGDRAIDAQAGAYAAGLNKAPILLTQKSSVPTYTVNAIKTLKATKAIVLGDSNSVDDTALAQMRAAGLTVTVVAGADRFETAADIYNLGSTKATTVFLARADLLAGQVSPDALAASPLSYNGTPVLLTNAGNLPTATADAIKAGGVKNVIVLGNAITKNVTDAVSALGATVTTIAGDDRSLTAQKIADYGMTNGAYGNTAATIANGDRIDALSAGPWAALNKAPILLTLGTGTLGTGTTGYLAAHASTLTKATVFGDTNSVPAGLTAAAKTAGGGDIASSQSYTVSTGDTAVNSTTGTRSYTVTGLAVGTPVRIALVTPTSVDNGTFVLDSTKRIADLTAATSSKVDAINGVDIATPAATLSFTPQTSSITFQVRGGGAEAVVPVVFDNSDGSNSLSVNLAGVAKEKVGIGGKVTFQAAATTPSEAADGAMIAAATQSVSAVYSNGFTVATTADGSGVTGLFTFDGTDKYELEGNPITMAQFMSIFSPGDVIADLTYKASPTSTSFNTYNIAKDKVPTAGTIKPMGLASTTKLGQVTVTYESDSEFAAGSTSYKLQRRQVSAATTPVAGAAGQWATVDTRTVSAAGTQTFTETLPSGTYEYQVVVSSPSFSGTADVTSTVSSTVEVSTTSVLGIPGLQRLYLTSNASDINNLSKGDVFKVVLTQPISAPVSGSTLKIGAATLTSVSGNTSDTVGAANFSLNTAAEVVDGVSQDAGKVLTVTLLAAPSASAVPFSGNPALTTSSGIGNTAGDLPPQSGDNNILTKDVVS